MKEAAVEERLEGGNLTAAVRIGDTVRRAAGPWTESVHALLRHVRARGVGWVPEPLGRDEHGREVLTFLDGDVYPGELPDWIWADSVLSAAAEMLRRYHDATSGFDLRGRTWRLPPHEPAEVVCHNDFAPYNFVFRGRRLAGVIDWDTASPGPRAWDLAYLAYRLVPLAGPSNPEALPSSGEERARRLALLRAAYPVALDGAEFLDLVARRLDELAAFTAERAEEAGSGSPLWQHLALYRADAAYVRDAAARHRDGQARSDPRRSSPPRSDPGRFGV